MSIGTGQVTWVSKVSWVQNTTKFWVYNKLRNACQSKGATSTQHQKAGATPKLKREKKNTVSKEKPNIQNLRKSSPSFKTLKAKMNTCVDNLYLVFPGKTQRRLEEQVDQSQSRDISTAPLAQQALNEDFFGRTDLVLRDNWDFVRN